MHFVIIIWWLAVATEFLGVFCLSVEAIRLSRIRRIRKWMLHRIKWLNPPIVFVASNEDSQDSLVGHNFAILLVVVFFISTPLLLILIPTHWLLTKVEQTTYAGVIGTIGFGLWTISFLLNKLVLDGHLLNR